MSQRKYTIAHTESSMGWGGQEIRIMAEMVGMRERGHQMLLAAPEDSKVYHVAVKEGFDTLVLSRGQLAVPLNAFRLKGWLKKKQVDIVNPHSSRDGWSAGLGGRMAGTPMIIRSRHFEVPIANKPLSRLVYTKLADHLITTSPRISEQFQEAFGLSAERVTTLSTGIDVEKFHPEGSTAEFPAAKGQEDWPLVGMVAVMRQAKGHVFLVRAARILKDKGFPIRILIVGDGPSQAPIDAEIAKQGLQEHVTFSGYRTDVPDILRALDCAAFPSLHEGIPQVGLQALASGIPVTGSDVGGIPSVIRDGDTGRLFTAGDHEGLALQLEKVFQEKEKTKQMVENGLKLVREHHSIPVMLDQVEALYARLIG
ncbi:glycosyltransferase family 4 protein [Verrucomicrobia bacterium]|nr:glycosyltransferase family 4 protein [Verrucomicrobiota bacterium]